MSERAFRAFWFLAVLILALMVWDAAPAQTVTTKVNLTITPPTTNTDGSAITGTLTYTLYQGPKAGPFVQVAAGITATTTTVTSTASGNCFSVVASETVGTSVTASAPSPTVCAVVPSAPGGVAIGISVTLS